MAEYFCPVIQFILKFKLVFISSKTQLHMITFLIFMLNQQHPVVILDRTSLLHSCVCVCVCVCSHVWQELGRVEQTALRVCRYDERAWRQQQQAAAGGAPEEVTGGQLQAERVPAGGMLIQMLTFIELVRWLPAAKAEIG